MHPPLPKTSPILPPDFSMLPALWSFPKACAACRTHCSSQMHSGNSTEYCRDGQYCNNYTFNYQILLAKFNYNLQWRTCSEIGSWEQAPICGGGYYGIANGSMGSKGMHAWSQFIWNCGSSCRGRAGISISMHLWGHIMTPGEFDCWWLPVWEIVLAEPYSVRLLSSRALMVPMIVLLAEKELVGGWPH